MFHGNFSNLKKNVLLKYAVGTKRTLMGIAEHLCLPFPHVYQLPPWVIFILEYSFSNFQGEITRPYKRLVSLIAPKTVSM